MRVWAAFFRAVFFVFAAFSAPVAVRADDYGASLQRLHQSFAGFTTGDGRLRSLAYVDTATAIRSGEKVAQSTVHRIGMLYRIDGFNVKENTGHSSGFTGNLFWYSDFSGFVVPVFGDSAKAAIDDDLIFSDGIASLPWTSNGAYDDHGKKLSIVRVDPPHGLPVDLYIDPQTGAYSRIVVDPKGDYETTMLVLAYAQPLPNVNVISKWRVDQGQNEHAFSNLVANGDTKPDDLHPPARTASWDFANPNPFPVRFTKHRVLIKAKVNGVEGLFVLDSGADGILFSGKFARRAGLQATGHSEVGGPEIDEKVDLGVVPAIDFYGNVLHNATVFFGAKELDEEGPDGLIGFGLFGGTFATLDVEKSTLTLADPGPVDPETVPGIHVRVDLADGSPTVPMRVANRVDLYATLDTGDPEFAVIPWGLLASEGLRFTNDDGVCGNLDTLRLGPISFVTPRACLAEGMGRRGAIVGLPFFRGFAKVYFDYPAATMIFEQPVTPHKDLYERR